MSTRQASALPTWKPPAPTEGAARNATGQSGRPKLSVATTSRSAAQVKAAPAPLPDPAVVRKERLKANRNFDSDSDTEADKQRSRQNQNLSKLEQKLAAVEKEAAAKHPAPRLQHALQLQQQQYKSPYDSTGKAGVNKMRTVLPKGKAGAASRNMALAPQAIALSRKQMADRGIRQAVDSVCAQAPARPHHQPPLHAAPTSSSRQRHAMPSTSERRAPAMPSTAGRPLHLPSASPSRPFSSTAHCHQADGATQMPAWAQKAKQAVLAGRGTKRMRQEEPEYDNDFVVDDEEEPDWRQALKSITKYDPSKFDDRAFDDRSMEANFKQIQAEERRSARMGREDDRRAEEEELRHEEEKRKKKRRA